MVGANEFAIDPPPDIADYVRRMMYVVSCEPRLKSICLFLDEASLPEEDEDATRVLRFLKLLADNFKLLLFKIFVLGKYRASFVAHELECEVIVDRGLMNMFQDSRLQGSKLLTREQFPELQFS